MKTQPAFVTLFIAALITTACPGDQDGPGETTSDDYTTTAATLTTGIEDPTTAGSDDSTSTGDASTSSSTGAAPISCGQPSPDCVIAKREWCEDLQDICTNAGIGDTGNGVDYCILIQCPVTPACQTCFFIANTCKQLGKGEDYCNNVMADCLCRAAAHDLNIDA